MNIALALGVALIVFAASAFAAGPGGAAPADLPTVDALRAKIAAAAGARPAVETVRRTASGLDGSETILRSGDNVREIDVDGPLHAEFGHYNNQDWHQNANGQTVLDQPDPGSAGPDGFTTRVNRVNAPIQALVISRLDSAGDGTKDYVDPLTDRIVRRDVISAAQTTVYSYDDFRTVDGYTTAWHWTRRDGHPENDGDFHVQNIETRPVTVREIEIPPPRRALVEFPTGKTSVELPIHMVDNGSRFAVHVVIAGRGLDFLLDTGSPGITIDDDIARELGLAPVRTVSDASDAARFLRSTVIVPEIRAGDFVMHDVVVQTYPNSPAQTGGVKLAGALGFDFIAELHLRLDYVHGTVTAFRPSESLPETEANAMVVNVRLGTQHPLADAAVNGALGERFVIDTGSTGTLVIFDYFARRHPKEFTKLNRDAGLFPRAIGIGGPLDTEQYQLNSVDIGGLHLKNLDALVVSPKQYALGDTDGLIGAKVLHYFTLWLAYGDSQIVLVPNAYYRSATH